MTENRVVDGRRASTDSTNQLKAKKVRTPKSCDRCKSRKTKVSSLLYARVKTTKLIEKCIDPGSFHHKPHFQDALR